MKKGIAFFSAVIISLQLAVVPFAETQENEAAWDFSVPTEITDEVMGLFSKAIENLDGVGYEPIAYLGVEYSEEKSGNVHCILCRSTVVYPDAMPTYVLMYVNEHKDGTVEMQNIWDIWIPAHAVPSESSESPTDIEWPQNYYFSSGAGGWETEIFMGGDWSFSGNYHDSEMGSNSEAYPNGTLYYCDFTGQFSEPKLIGTNTYKLHLDWLEQEGNEGDEHIENEIRYVCSYPYGFDNAEDFILYAPGAPVSELSEDCIMWVHWYVDPEKDEYLPEGLFILYNENAQTAFVGMNEEFQY